MCKKIFIDFKDLTSHLKYFHNLPPNNLYICAFLECNQKISNFKAFSKHVRNKIKKIENINLEHNFSESEHLDNIEEENQVLQNEDVLRTSPNISELEKNISESHDETLLPLSSTSEYTHSNISSQPLNPLLSNSYIGVI